MNARWPEGNPSRVGHRRALVVDSLALLRELVGDVLVELGFAVTTAGTAEEGLDRFAGEQLLVTGLELPGVSGVELVSRLRRRHPEVGIVAVSENVFALAQASRAGADAVLLRPFDRDVLQRAVLLIETIGQLAPAAQPPGEVGGRWLVGRYADGR